jgi:hypothetical protein
MKINELIKELYKMRDKYGDIDVFFKYDTNQFMKINELSIIKDDSVNFVSLQYE